jgi:hypothetical protein
VKTGGLAGKQPQSTLDLQKCLGQPKPHDGLGDNHNVGQARSIEAGTRVTPQGRALFKKRYAVPPEKGAWVWLVGPMVVGLAAAPWWNLETVAVLVGATSAFMLRQPATLAIRSHGRARGDLVPGLAWSGVYGCFALVSGAWLLWQGHVWVLGAGLAGLVMFGRHLWLVHRGDDRHRIGMDVAAAGLLALTAPAMMLVASRATAVALVLWLVLWLQASGSIVHMFLRLEQRKLKTMPSLRSRWTRGTVPLAHHGLNVLLAVGLVYWGLTPALVIVAFLLTLVEGVVSVARPPVRATPKQLGMRQLYISSVFMLIVAGGYVVL